MRPTNVTGSRRERVRAATVEEIKATARRLLVEQGQHSVTLRAIAREMGMTAPALYRYFPSHEDLLLAVIADIYNELAGELEAARDELPADDRGGQLFAMGRRFRSWSVSHREEFGLVFASPPTSVVEVLSPLDKAGNRFAGVFIGSFFALWTAQPFPVPADDELPPDLVRQLSAYRALLGEAYGDALLEFPIGAFQLFLSCWIRLYGFVAMDVFNHLVFCLDNAEPAFETLLAEIATSLGFRAPPPAVRGA